MNGNAIIGKTHIGYEDHGILTVWLFLESPGNSQGFGGFGCNTNASFWIKRILDTVGVLTWEELKGKHVRVDGNQSHISGIGHIMKNNWFYPKAELEEMESNDS